MSFWWKIRFFFLNGFWPGERQTEIATRLYKWTEANREQAEGRMKRK